MGIVIGICSRGPLEFGGRFLGTCAVFYVLFLCRMLGAGDIKLMGVCVGILGVSCGIQMIFCGLLLALAVEIVKGNRWCCGYVRFREIRVRLAPYLLGGYCFVVLWGYFLPYCCT